MLQQFCCYFSLNNFNVAEVFYTKHQAADKPDEEMGKFYNELRKTTKNLNNHDLNVTMVVFNAKVGKSCYQNKQKI